LAAPAGLLVHAHAVTAIARAFSAILGTGLAVFVHRRVTPAVAAPVGIAFSAVFGAPRAVFVLIAHPVSAGADALTAIVRAALAILPVGARSVAAIDTVATVVGAGGTALLGAARAVTAPCAQAIDWAELARFLMVAEPVPALRLSGVARLSTAVFWAAHTVFTPITGVITAVAETSDGGTTDAPKTHRCYKKS
jgi:hypothetical protein